MNHLDQLLSLVQTTQAWLQEHPELQKSPTTRPITITKKTTQPLPKTVLQPSITPQPIKKPLPAKPQTQITPEALSQPELPAQQTPTPVQKAPKAPLPTIKLPVAVFTQKPIEVQLLITQEELNSYSDFLKKIASAAAKEGVPLALLTHPLITPHENSKKLISSAYATLHPDALQEAPELPPLSLANLQSDVKAKTDLWKWILSLKRNFES